MPVPRRAMSESASVQTDAIHRLRESFEKLTPRLGELSESFYARLFTAAPETRKLFPTDMTRQRGHFEAALALLFRNLTLLDALTPSLMALGAEHVAFGARPEHYEIVRRCLIDAARELSGPEWSRQLDQDWWDAVTAVAQPMLRGAAIATTGAAERFADG